MQTGDREDRRGQHKDDLWDYQLTTDRRGRGGTRLWRDHWTIENRVHRVRDVTIGEDTGQIRTDHAPRALAALRNSVISLLRSKGWSNIADGLRYYGVSVPQALELIRAVPA